MDDKILEILRKEVSVLEKRYGAGIVTRYGENDITPCASISTGSISLDAAIGIGGVPVGRITEVFGAESSGKTSLCLKVIANAQKEGKICAIIDSENALDLGWAQRIGVKVEDLLISQPDFGEAAIDVAKGLAGTGHIGVIVFDSVAAMQPKEVIESDTNKAHIAQLARMMSQEMPKLSSMISNNNVACLFTNQIRDSMQMGWGYAPPYTTPGGHALKFFASLRVECKAGAKNEQGRWTRAKCVKNKVSSPFREGKFFIDYKKGFDSEYEIYEIAKDKKIIIASGAWWRFSNDEANKTFGTVSGWTKVIDRLRVDEDYKSAMLQLIYMSGGALVEASSGSESFDKEES